MSGLSARAWCAARNAEAPRRAKAASIWAFRQRTEAEAADLFFAHGRRLSRVGAPQGLVDMAHGAGDDEKEHERLCANLVAEFRGFDSTPSVTLVREHPTDTWTSDLGPSNLTEADRALYTSVAMGCITETIATALLIELRLVADHPGVKRTVQHILRDEVKHSRLGWAHLGWAATKGSVAWLGAYVPAMIRASVQEERDVALAHEGLADLGVLSAKRSQEVIARTLKTVVLPGLQRFGVERS